MNVIDQARGEMWSAYHGDSAEVLPGLPSESIDLSVYSPPFGSLFTYSASERDLGNSRTDAEFFEHYRFIVSEVLRVTKPGRVTAVHVADTPAMLNRDGYIGLKDFSGDVIRLYIAAGWIFDSRIPIDKNQQAQCLRDGTPVLTPFGWKAIERITPGEYVIGKNGQPTRVLEVAHHGRKLMYRVTFSDGFSIDTDINHRWSVRTLGSRATTGAWQTLTTGQMKDGGLYTPSGRRRYEIPLSDPVEFGLIANLPLDPYLLGALIGDGNVSQRSVAALTALTEVTERCELPDGHTWTRQPGSDRAGGAVATYNVKGPEWHRNDVLEALRGLGLQGKRSWEKFLPESYLMASIPARRALLQGLLDTDGSLKKNGAVVFHTTSEQLADDVAQLVQSLGGVARIGLETSRRYQHKGEDRIGRDIYRVSVGITGDWCPFTLPHKVDRWKEGRRQPRREIVSIESTYQVERCACIVVEASDSLYVAQHGIVTHNSIRTHAKGLTMTQMEKDRTWSRPALPDYILKFRKPGENAVPVRGGDVTRDLWIEWANPTWPREEDRAADAGAMATWYGIRETDTLQAAEGRESDDERHICPLQLGTIERCVRLWSNAGETVLTPFLGIGSEAYEAVKLGRRAIGIELKASYFGAAVKNLQRLEAIQSAQDMFSLFDAPAEVA